MRMPIRNRGSQPITLFVEPYCDEYVIGAGAEAVITLEDGKPHSLDLHPESWVTLWDEGGEALVEIVSEEQNLVVDALSFARIWLFRAGPEGEAAVKSLDADIEHGEAKIGYVKAGFAAYAAFREGFGAMQSRVGAGDAALSEGPSPEALAGAFQAGRLAAAFNERVRLMPTIIELGEPPFETATARRKFEQADAVIQASR